MDELSELRAKLEQEREEFKREREKFEQEQEASREQTLAPFITQGHNLHNLFKVAGRKSYTTQGATTNPASRWYPERIVHWDDFGVRQMNAWDQYGEDVWKKAAYTPATNMRFLELDIDPIGSEDDLRYQHRSIVENRVKEMFSVITEDVELRRNLPQGGKISFENQAMFRRPSADIAAQPRRNTRADRFCVRWSTDETNQPLIAVEFKPPHKLSIEQICMGLRSTIDVEADIRAKDDDDTIEFQCRSLVTVVLTQLFSYMIDTNVQYGYLCTGEVYVFVWISTDPTVLYYNVNIPKRDWEYDAEHRLKRTAVSQVFAFVHQALSAPRPVQPWSREATTKLKKWDIQYDDILRNIPETVRKSPDTSAYKVTNWALRNIRASPIVTRSTRPMKSGLLVMPQASVQTVDGARDSDKQYRGTKRSYLSPSMGESEITSEDEAPSPASPTSKHYKPSPRDRHDSDDEDGAPPTSSATRSQSRIETNITRSVRGQGRQNRGKQSGDKRQGRVRSKTVNPSDVSIDERPYCTHQCLLSLSQGRGIDQFCPNAADHVKTPPLKTVLDDIKLQLEDLTDKNSCALNIYGTCGAMLKIRSTLHGYTFIAKAVDEAYKALLRHEASIYGHLQSIQGKLIPVCCGLTTFDVPFHYNGAGLTCIMLLSYGGMSVATLMENEQKYALISSECGSSASDALMTIRQLGVDHGDTALRNFLYDECTERVMIIDFERSQIVGRRPLGQISSNRNKRGPLIDVTTSHKKQYVPTIGEPTTRTTHRRGFATEGASCNTWG